jgi:hypothetical protein
MRQFSIVIALGVDSEHGVVIGVLQIRGQMEECISHCFDGIFRSETLCMELRQQESEINESP